MRRFLRWLLNFLDRKFPDKIYVTEAMVKDFQARLDQHANQIKILEAKIAALEVQIANINLAIGFSAPKMGVLER